MTDASAGASDPAQAVCPTPLGARVLRGFGLSGREAKLYLALLEAGPSSGRRSSETSGLHRATTYRAISRLAARGLVRAERTWPREYRALPVRVVVERGIAFLRDEIELRQWLLRALPLRQDAASDVPGEFSWRHFAHPPSKSPPPPTVPSVRVTAIGTGSESPLLAELRGARRAVDALIRPLRIPSALRSRVASSLARTAMRGLPVRVALDHLTADRAFAAALERERSPHGSDVEIRHFTPLDGHLYIIDQRRAIRFPMLSSSPRGPDFGLVTEDIEFVRAQTTRFDWVWKEAVARGTLALGVPWRAIPPRAVTHVTHPTVSGLGASPLGNAVGKVPFR